MSDAEMLVAEKQKIEMWQAGPSAGYGYTYIMKKYYSLSGSISLGVNVSFNTLNSGERTVNVFPSALPKVAFGYNNDSWGINLSFLANISYAAELGDDKLTFATGNFSLNYIKRFNLNFKNTDKG